MKEIFNQEAIDQSFKRYTVGNEIEGYVVMKNENGVVLNIGGKKDAFIYNEDLRNKDEVQLNDCICGIIKEVRDENGFVRVSQKDYDFKKECDTIFKEIRIGKIIEVRPTLVVNGGIIAKYFNFNIFIPTSHLEFKNRRNPSIYLNKLIKVVVIQVEVVSKKVVASIKNLIEQEKQEQENNFWSQIESTPIVKGKVKKLTEFGAFIEVFGKDCLILNKDVGYFNEKAKDTFKVGEEHNFVVVETRKDENKVLLGFKQLKDDPRKKLYAKYNIGQKYNGEVVKMFNYGVVVKLEDNVTGFLHISDAEYGLLNMQEAYKLGENISVKIKEIDLEKNKISLERKYDYEYELD